MAGFLRHAMRRNALTYARLRGLRAREGAAADAVLARQQTLLRTTIAAARARLLAYAAMPPLAHDGDPIDWLQRYAPVLTKADLLAGRQRLYPARGAVRAWWPTGRTSGTTGTPLEVIRSVDSVIWEEAFQLQAWMWTGWRPGQWQAVLRGDVAVPHAQQRPPFWRAEWAARQLLLSTRHLNDATAGAMLDALDAAAPTLLRGYPSALAELARLAQNAGRRLHLPAVLTSSEPLYPVQRAAIEAAFGAPLFDCYGMAERVAFAAQCEHGQLHLHPEYAFVEIVGDDGRASGGFGDIVGTTLHNRLMPLLRYRLADRARWLPGACACGRTSPRIELASGKLEDQLFDGDGHAVSASIVTFAFKGLAHIRRAQVAQVGQGEWIVRIVPDRAYRDADGAALLRNIATLVSARVAVRVQLVDALALQPSGKFRWLVQEWHGAPR